MPGFIPEIYPVSGVWGRRYPPIWENCESICLQAAPLVAVVG